MRKNVYLIWIWFLLAGILVGMTACSYTKTVPDGQYLLNDTRIKVKDTKNVNTDDLKGYLRQTENTEVFGFWKMQLNLYNWAGTDTSKWINRTLHRMGEAPEIYNDNLTKLSMQNLQQAMANKGYLNAVVDTTIQYKKNPKLLNLTYQITAKQPYLLRNYTMDLPNEDLLEAAKARTSKIERGMLFDANMLEEERQRITNRMRRNGYYLFEKDYLQFIADSAWLSHEVDVHMKLQDFITENDFIREQLFTKFTITHVFFHTEYDKTVFTEADVDTTWIGHYMFTQAGEPILRNKTLIRACKLIPGMLYDERIVEETYAALNELGPIKYVNISFKQLTEDELACEIVLSRDKIHSVTAEVEGTYSAGDWGVAAGVGYVNRNIFRGGEQWSINGRCSYEWRQNGSRGIEAKGETALRFPNSLEVNVAVNYQQRPDEFTRVIASAGMRYGMMSRNRRWKHYFTPLDISYVYLPSISQEFADKFLRDDNILKYSYEDHFIVGWSYTGSYSNKRANQPLRDYVNLQYQVETAGNVLYGLSHLFNQEKTDGVYKIFNIQYAQYAKADAQVTYHQHLGRSHSLVWHLGAGVAVPFGNASVIPFEKRYYAGGANSVRGWTIRSLGPGAYQGTGSRIDYNNQSGDIKLDLNLEYRAKVFKMLELAAFTDAGNVWTIRDYESQKYGKFSKDFYKQLAWSYGVGIRLDLSFLVLRLDLGVKLYDPQYLYSTTPEKVWRTVPNGLKWKDDMTLHFAIGYPF